MARRITDDPLPHLHRRAGLARDLKRATNECFALAEKEMRPRSGDEGVHRVRQALKRARAILRLAEDAGLAEAETLRRDVAAVARKFSPLRDAAVVMKMAQRFAAKDTSDAGAFAHELANEKPPSRNALWWESRRRELAALRHRLAGFESIHSSPNEIERSLEVSAKRVCRRARRACRDHDIETAHEWRKKIILLREQVFVARPLFGEDAAKLRTLLARLTKKLGRGVDWRVFLEAAERDSKGFADGKAKLLEAGRKKQKRALKKARKIWKKLEPRLRADFP